MVLTLKVPLKQAEKWKKYLLTNNLFGTGNRAAKDKNFIYYPVTKRFEILRGDTEFVERDVPETTIRKSLKEKLKEELSVEEIEFLKSAHDIVGTIAILEIPEYLSKREKIIAETLLATNKNVKTVLKKAAKHQGVFRTQKMTYLAGVDTKIAFYKENGAILKLDVENVYFSVRLSNERLRISKLVKPGEDILVMFSGCAPYPIVLAKKTKAKHIVGIEINPDGHKYGLESVKLNKIKNVDLLCGDVHEVIPQLAKSSKDGRMPTFDRIIMPLPKTADEFLSDALKVSRKGTIIHFYDFLDESDFDEAKRKVSKACSAASLKFKILDLVKCGQHAPHVFRICLDFEIV